MSKTTSIDSSTREQRKVLAGTLIGTTIEWYDFFIYAQAAGLVFAQLYFSPLGQEGGVWAQLVAWASLGISFLFRPLGAIIAGQMGDKYGRKIVLIVTLTLMGAATALIGLLPTYTQIGLAAPLLLLLLRVLQGLSAGGEWGGAVLMAVEHAPNKRRGYFGAYPQVGVPAGMVIATLVMFAATGLTTDEQFMAWGWRVPFLFSVVLIVVGYFIRRSIAESPVFQEMLELKSESSTPLRSLFRSYSKSIAIAALSHIGSNASGYLFIAFWSSYAIGVVGIAESAVLLATAGAAVMWILATLLSGQLSDRIGRIRTIQLGYVLMFIWMIPLVLLIDQGDLSFYTLSLTVFSIGNGLTYGPLPSMYAEMFPASVRFSGISISYALGAVFGGAFAPMIAELLFGMTGSSLSIAAYIMLMFIVSFIAVTLIPDRRARSLRTEVS